jgi:hypothetical protein
MEWKSLPTLEMSSHVTYRTSKDIIISSIPWNPATFPNGFKISDWINNKATGHLAPLTWIYRVAEVLPNLVKAIEFRKISSKSLIIAMSSQEVTFSPVGYILVRVLFQTKHGAPFKVVKDFSALPKSTIF